MKKEIINSNQINSNTLTNENHPRVFARLLTQKLSQQEIKMVAGGNITCEKNQYPQKDMKCCH